MALHGNSESNWMETIIITKLDRDPARLTSPLQPKSSANEALDAASRLTECRYAG